VGEPQGEGVEVEGGRLIPVGVGEVAELVDGSVDAAVGGPGQAAVCHGRQFGVDEPAGDAVGGEDPFQCGGEPGEDGGGRGERHEHRQQGRLVDEQGHLRSPQEDGGVPGAERGGGWLGGWGGGTADPVEELLGAVDDQHQRSDAGRFPGDLGVEPVDDVQDRQGVLAGAGLAEPFDEMVDDVHQGRGVRVVAEAAEDEPAVGDDHLGVGVDQIDVGGKRDADLVDQSANAAQASATNPIPSSARSTTTRSPITAPSVLRMLTRKLMG
jgi:hypothetical protein